LHLFISTNILFIKERYSSRLLLHYHPMVLSCRWKIPHQRICTGQNKLFHKITNSRKKDEENGGS